MCKLLLAASDACSCGKVGRHSPCRCVPGISHSATLVPLVLQSGWFLSLEMLDSAVAHCALWRKGWGVTQQSRLCLREALVCTCEHRGAIKETWRGTGEWEFRSEQNVGLRWDRKLQCRAPLQPLSQHCLFCHLSGDLPHSPDRGHSRKGKGMWFRTENRYLGNKTDICLLIISSWLLQIFFFK